MGVRLSVHANFVLRLSLTQSLFYFLPSRKCPFKGTDTAIMQKLKNMAESNFYQEDEPLLQGKMHLNGESIYAKEVEEQLKSWLC